MNCNGLGYVSQDTKDRWVEETTNPLMTKLYSLVDEIDATCVIRTAMQTDVDADLTTIITSCEQTIDNTRDAVGRYLHRLYVERPTMNDARKLISSVPEALLHENEEGEIPIISVVKQVGGMKYVPLLAVEASRRKIGPERGGLLLRCVENRSANILKIIVSSTYKERPTWYEEECLQALKDLYGADMLLCKDIVQFDLIRHATHKEALRRLDFLVQMYPKALSTPRSNGNYHIHPSNYVDSDDIDVFTLLLKVGMQYYPEKLGFLFKKNKNGEMPINQAIHLYGKNETLNAIQKIIPPTENHPILHHVIRFTPELGDDFACRYPDAMHLKDRHGRYLLHVAVRSGYKLSFPLLSMVHSNKASLGEKDPLTNLYPFMLAAASGGRHEEDLTTTYKLLSLHPEVITKCLNGDSGEDDANKGFIYSLRPKALSKWLGANRRGVRRMHDTICMDTTTLNEPKHFSKYVNDNFRTTSNVLEKKSEHDTNPKWDELLELSDGVIFDLLRKVF